MPDDLKGDSVAEQIVADGLPLTRENYIAYNGAGLDLPTPYPVELEEQLPRRFRSPDAWNPEQLGAIALSARAKRDARRKARRAARG